MGQGRAGQDYCVTDIPRELWRLHERLWAALGQQVPSPPRNLCGDRGGPLLKDPVC